MKLQHLSQLSAGSDRNVAMGPHRLPLFTSHAVCPVAVGPRSRCFNNAARSISREPAYRGERDGSLGCKKKRQLSVWSRHEVYRLTIWILVRIMAGHGPDRMTTWPNRDGC